MIKKMTDRILKDDIARSSFINTCIKPISLVIALLSTPLLLGYLGNEQYGIWATILSITSWINYCDVGIGHGLRNLLSKQLAQEDISSAKKAIATAYICMTGISFVLLIVLCCTTFIVNWKWVFNTTIDVENAILISFIFICVNFVLVLCNTILYALQKSEGVSIRGIFIQIINIIGLIALKRIGNSSITYVAILFGVSTTFTYVITSFRLIRKYNFVRFSIKDFDTLYIKNICNVGIKFFIIQISVIFMYTVDNIIITRLFGASAVTSYSMVDKVYTAGYGVFAAVMVPFWSAATQALAKKNYDWFDNTIKKLNFITLIFSIGYIIVGICFQTISNIWLGTKLEYPKGLITVMVVYYILQSFQNPYCQFNNGIGALNGQMWLGIFQGAMNIPLSVFFASKCNFGVVGVKLATTILMALSALFQPCYFYKQIKKIKNKAS